MSTSGDYPAKLTEVIAFARKIEDLKRRVHVGVRQNSKTTDRADIDLSVEDCAIIVALITKALE